MRTILEHKPVEKREHKGYVHCPMCTHTVETNVITAGRSVYVKTGERCPRCSAALDAGYVLQIQKAA